MAAIIEFGFNDARVRGGLSSLERRLGSFSRSVSSQLGGVFASLGAGFALRGAVEAVNTYDRMGRALATLEGSAEGAQQRMALLRETAKLPGLAFEQAVQGDVRLRSVGISAELSRRALMEMGNALALAGGTASDLDGVVLALTQIISKGKVSAEEINQIAERVPQVRAVMKDMFGTADTEVLQRMNIDAETFVSTLVEGFGRLDRATAGNTEKMEDFATAIKTATVAFSEGFVGQGVEGASRLGAVLDANNSKIRELGGSLSSALATGVEWIEKAGSGLGQMAWEIKNAASALMEGQSLEQYRAEYNEILQLNQAIADRAELERQYQAIAAQAPPPDPLARPDAAGAGAAPGTPGTPGSAKPGADVEDARRKQEELRQAQQKAAQEQMTAAERMADLRQRIADQEIASAAYGTLSGPQGESLQAEAEIKKLQLQRELNELLKAETAQRQQAADAAAEAAAATAQQVRDQTAAKAELAQEFAILQARAAGDEKRAASMERELRIRERAAQIEAQTGVSAEAARRAAESMERFRDQITAQSAGSSADGADATGRRRGHIGGVTARHYMIGGGQAGDQGTLSERHARNVGQSSAAGPEPTRDILTQLLKVTAQGFNG
jgi:tape measure domain-containing protein